MQNDKNGGTSPAKSENSTEKKGGSRAHIVRLLGLAADFDYRFSGIIVAVSLILCILCLLYTAGYLKFDPDQANLIKRSAGLQAEQDRYTKAFPRAEDIVVLVEDGTIAQRRAFVDELAVKLRSEPDTFAAVFEKVDVSPLRSYAMHYMGAKDLKEVSAMLERGLPVFRQVASSKGIGSLLTVSAENGGTLKDAEQFLPVINRFVKLFEDSMKSRGRLKGASPWLEAFFGYADTEDDALVERASGVLSEKPLVIYNTVAKGRFYLLLCRPVYRSGEGMDVSSERAVKRIREILASMQRVHNKVLVGLTGEVVLNVDEASSSASDSVKSAVISLILIAVVFVWAFRECWKPLMAVLSLIVGVSWAMGFTTLAIGHLNLLTVTCATILMGLGIDFGIHFLYRYDEESAKERDSRKAMRTALQGAGYENFTGAFSTALAFYALAFTDFTGIAELGIIAGSGILLCCIAMTLMLPSLIFMRERSKTVKRNNSVARFAVLAEFEKMLLGNAESVLAVCAVLTAAALWYGSKVSYDYNLLNLQAKGLQSVQTELHLMKSSDFSLLCGISLAKDAETACALADKFSKLPTVANVETAAAMIPSDYESKKVYLEKITRIAAAMPLPEVPSHDSEKSRIEEFKKMGAELENGTEQIDALFDRLLQSPDKTVRSDAKKLRRSIDSLFKTMSGMGPGAIEEGLDGFEHFFFSSMRELIVFLRAQRSAPPFTINDLPASLREREIGTGGEIQVRVFPKENVWERPAQERFVHDLQKVDPNVIGMPVMSYYDCQELRVSNEKAGVWALAAVWTLLFIHFRGGSAALLALLPKVVGIIWMVGIMGFLGADFNSANCLALPLILGIGLVFGVHIIHRVSEEDSAGIFSHSTGPSITLSAVTTIIGFATMIAADHQGVASLGLVMTAGVAANLFSSSVMLPALISVLRRRFGYKLKVHS